MYSLRRKARLALAGMITAGALASPLAAQADAAPVVKLRPVGSAKFLTYDQSIGAATLKPPSSALINFQRWELINGDGPAKYYRNIGNFQCMRAHPTNNTFVRTQTCDFNIKSIAGRQQQWIFSSPTGQLANLDRFERGIAANSLPADFNDINRLVGLAPFTGGANQVWKSFAG